MSERPSEEATGSQGRLAGIALAVFAIVCCAGGPVLVAAHGGVTVGALLGVRAGGLGAVAIVAVTVIGAQRRARASRSGGRQGPDPGKGAGAPSDELMSSARVLAGAAATSPRITVARGR